MQPITSFIRMKELDSMGLSKMQLELLKDILIVLEMFHVVQEGLSSERTPTLAMALPAYEEILSTLSGYIQNDSFPNLIHAIYVAQDKICKYVEVARSNNVYAIAMCK
jgi:hypothetical protein